MIQVIVVGAGERARSWAGLIQQSPHMQIVAVVVRSLDTVLEGVSVPHHQELDWALTEFPNAVVAIALPPRAGRHVADSVASSGRRGLAEAPIAATNSIPSQDSSIQIAHGWVNLPGRRWIEAQGTSSDAIFIDVRGLPESPTGSLDEVLVHGLALARRLAGTTTICSVNSPGEHEITVKLGEGGRVQLRARTHGHALEVRRRTPNGETILRWTPHQEQRVRIHNGQKAQREKRVPTATERALHQLIDPANAGGDNLHDAHIVSVLAQDVLRMLPTKPLISDRRLKHAAYLMNSRPDALLDRLGLEGDWAGNEPVECLLVKMPPEPLELWAFRAGLKPVAFLTMKPEEEQATRALFTGAHIERRERRVLVGAQDAWRDERSLGEPRVELYISNDKLLAEKAVSLQADLDPSEAVNELGALMGYPQCCVEAFSRLTDRSNNTRNRYASAAGALATGPWPWQLNNLFIMLVPFYPCSYCCPQALSYAKGTIKTLNDAYPGIETTLKSALSKPVLYFDHDHMLIFDGELTGDLLNYTGVSVPYESNSDMAKFARDFVGQEFIRWQTSRLVVGEGSSFRRTDPALGFLAPFGRVE